MDITSKPQAVFRAAWGFSLFRKMKAFGISESFKIKAILVVSLLFFSIFTPIIEINISCLILALLTGVDVLIVEGEDAL